MRVLTQSSFKTSLMITLAIIGLVIQSLGSSNCICEDPHMNSDGGSIPLLWQVILERKFKWFTPIRRNLTSLEIEYGSQRTVMSTIRQGDSRLAVTKILPFMG